MKKAITIRIPEPCHEDWAKMTPTQKGRHCKVCTKEVVDFSQKTDEQLVKLISGNNNLCGRFKKSQLDREVKLERKSSNSLLPYAASLLLPLSLAASSLEQGNYNKLPVKQYTSLGIGSQSLTTLTGLVTNIKGELIINATIKVLETGVEAISNKRGQFIIEVNPKNTLVVSHKDYHTQEIIIPSAKGAVNIKLESKETVIIKAEATTSHVTYSESISKTVGKIAINNQITITGTVTDDADLPLPGANIIIKGTTQGTQTDFDGNYSITVEAGQTLVFSYVGFDDKEIKTSNISNNVDIMMNSAMMGGISVGVMIVSESGYNYSKPRFANDAERQAWKEKLKLQAKNEKEFAKIKKARKKAERALKRKNKKE